VREFDGVHEAEALSDILRRVDAAVEGRGA